MVFPQINTALFYLIFVVIYFSFAFSFLRGFWRSISERKKYFPFVLVPVAGDSMSQACFSQFGSILQSLDQDCFPLSAFFNFLFAFEDLRQLLFVFGTCGGLNKNDTLGPSIWMLSHQGAVPLSRIKRCGPTKAQWLVLSFSCCAPIVKLSPSLAPCLPSACLLPWPPPWRQWTKSLKL